MPHRMPLRSFVVAGTRACSHRSGALMARSTRGSTHGGVRWKTVSRDTSGWMDGTIWMAEAPVPTMATRLPPSGTPWSQRAEWKTLPGNVSRPGMSGILGSDSGPVAETTTSAVSSACAVSISQCSSSSSQRMLRTSWSKRMCCRIPKMSATCSR